MLLQNFVWFKGFWISCFYFHSQIKNCNDLFSWCDSSKASTGLTKTKFVTELMNILLLGWSSATTIVFSYIPLITLYISLVIAKFYKKIEHTIACLIELTTCRLQMRLRIWSRQISWSKDWNTFKSNIYNCKINSTRYYFFIKYDLLFSL